jgi:hypothetical protein
VFNLPGESCLGGTSGICNIILNAVNFYNQVSVIKNQVNQHEDNLHSLNNVVQGILPNHSEFHSYMKNNKAVEGEQFRLDLGRRADIADIIVNYFESQGIHAELKCTQDYNSGLKSFVDVSASEAVKIIDSDSLHNGLREELNKSAEENYQKGLAAEKKKDYKSAAYCYQCAEQLGHIKAKTNLAHFYIHSISGLGEDKQRAFQLLSVAADAGHERAKINLTQLSKEMELEKKQATEVNEEKIIPSPSMQSDQSSEEDQYVFVIPRGELMDYKGDSIESNEYNLSLAGNYESIKSSAEHWARIEGRDFDESMIVKLNIPKEDYVDKFCKDKGTYCGQDRVDQFLSANEEVLHSKSRFR